MKRDEAHTVGEIVKAFLSNENLDGKIYEQQILSQWQYVVGNVANRYTVSRYISNGILYVQLSSAALRNELLMHKTKLIEALNKMVNKDIIKDIIFK